MKNFLVLLSTVLFFASCSSGNHIWKPDLDGTWVMHKMTGIELNKKQLTKGLPVFTFDLSGNRFSGHAGCNQLASGISISGSEITFGIIIRTEMACPNMEVENAVINILNENTLQYKVEDSVLILTSSNGLEMQFNHDRSD